VYVFVGVYSDGCITKAPNDALRSVLMSQSASKLDDWSTTSAGDLGSYFTLGVKSEDVPLSSSVPVSSRTPAATPRPSSSHRRVSNKCKSHVYHTSTLPLFLSFFLILYGAPAMSLT